MEPRFKRSFMVDLTDKEVSRYSEELARITTKLAELEDEKKAVMSGYNDKIHRAISDARIIARKISSREEMREIDCEWKFDFNTALAKLIREDTGEQIETRQMTEKELQLTFPEGGEQ